MISGVIDSDVDTPVNQDISVWPVQSHRQENTYPKRCSKISYSNEVAGGRQPCRSSGQLWHSDARTAGTTTHGIPLQPPANAGDDRCQQNDQTVQISPCRSVPLEHTLQSHGILSAESLLHHKTASQLFKVNNEWNDRHAPKSRDILTHSYWSVSEEAFVHVNKATALNKRGNNYMQSPYFVIFLFIMKMVIFLFHF